MSDQVRILVLAANPKTKASLDLNAEYEQIEEALRESRYAAAFLLQHRWKIGREQLLDLLQTYRPHILHFSGHGTTDNLILQDREGNPWPFDRRLAREAFKAARETLHLVMLNACYSRDIAEDVSEVIDCVVGMASNILDSTAIQFASAFYRGFGAGLSVLTSFDQARFQIALSGLEGNRVPQLLSKPGVDPRRLQPLEWAGFAAPERAASVPAAVRHAGQANIPTSRPELRKALVRYLQSDEDFDAFVVDHFSDVYLRFSGSMDRMARINLLMVMMEPDEIAEALKRQLG